ncbi:MAG: biopolymer transporter ExbD, partial [Bacteroidota bacterium]
MAEVNTTSDKNGKRASPSSKRRAAKVDMTAMVDVAFLLLTFFVLTATLQTDKLIETVMPPPCDGEDCHPKVDERKMLTLLVDVDDKLFYFVGTPEQSKLQETTYAAEGLRSVILEHLNRYPNRCDQVGKTSDCWDPIFVIKANPKSRYRNMIDLMDELEIVGAPKYVFADYD